MTSSLAPSSLTADHVQRVTTDWLEKAVIGLNLCPFAKSVHVKGQVRYTVYLGHALASLADTLADTLAAELQWLADADPEAVDTTLLVAPNCLQDFLDFNDFLGEADALLAQLGLEGVLQIASLHPDYQFAGTEPDDITNFTNRSPYPTLHLLREASIDRAVAAFPDPESIYEVNMRRLQALGLAGWNALGLSR